MKRGPVESTALYRQLLLAQQPSYGSLIELERPSDCERLTGAVRRMGRFTASESAHERDDRRGRFREEDEARA